MTIILTQKSMIKFFMGVTFNTLANF